MANDPKNTISSQRTLADRFGQHVFVNLFAKAERSNILQLSDGGTKTDVKITVRQEPTVGDDGSFKGILGADFEDGSGMIFSLKAICESASHRRNALRPLNRDRQR